MDITALLQSIEATELATQIREGESWFPWLESLHVLAVTLVFGSIAIVDFRLLGWAMLDRAVTRIEHAVLPITWTAFVLAVITGALLFASNALSYATNSWFMAKFIFIALAGANMAVFQLGVLRDVQRWDRLAQLPQSVKMAGALSLIFWIAVITCGRWVGFSLQPGM
jgi:general stress protein CsbA